MISKPDQQTFLSQHALDGNWDRYQQLLADITIADVEKALSAKAGSYTFDKLLALVSPAAENHLEEMAQRSRDLTIQRFGPTIKLYAPLYVSNYCSNSCVYCGFNRQTEFERKRLTVAEAVAEAEIIAAEGFRDILLVSSEDRGHITIDYLCELARKLRGKFSSIGVEIYQCSSKEYANLFAAGIEAVTVYQETYNRTAYAKFHPAGSKADYDMRLQAPSDAAAGKMRQIGLGSLLGLNDWRIETLALGEHGHFLMKRYWQSRISFSFPRLRPAMDVKAPVFENPVSDKNLVQMITALRLCFADAGLVLSTRESPDLRDKLMPLGITRMSAGSRTEPGGYSEHGKAVEQFQISDDRTPAEVAKVIRNQGFEAVWKDWDSAFNKKDS
ncbi:MAG TPA: 2-iminoacetate synthase ThiH [Phycisphaerales bacterium]|nr:2-iminoacetate synthase ThiH [Phycisphaerales bacterium]